MKTRMCSMATLLFATLLFAAITRENTASAETLTFSLDAVQLEKNGRLIDMIFDSGAKSIRLKDILLVEDDAPGIGMPEDASNRSWFEKLKKGIAIRKTLVLDDPRAFSGLLLFNGLEMKDNTCPLNIDINGHHFIRPPSKYATPQARQYYTRDWGGDVFDNWFFVEIPVGALIKGENEIRLWAESDSTSWEIMVADAGEFFRGSETHAEHPDRSARSTDGGNTWDKKHLGWKGVHDGEYCIRLSLDRSVPRGRYLSPVIDCADTLSTMHIRRMITPQTVGIAWDIDTSDDTEAHVSVRFGPSPAPDAKEWGRFIPVDGFSTTRKNPEGRYLQFRIEFSTANPLETPRLNGVTVSCEYDSAPIGTSRMHRVVNARNGQIVRSSRDYRYEEYARLADMRKRFELDKVVEGASGEFEAQLRLMRWAYEIPIDGLDRLSWDYYDLPRLERDTDGTIHRQTGYTGRRRDKHCLYCNLTLAAALISMGHQTRWVNIATRTTYGHEVVEVWSNEFDKWIFLDATRDYYIYDPATGIPMSLVEINSRLAEIMPGKPDWKRPIRWIVPSDSLAYRARLAYREGDNAYTITDIHQGPHLLMLKGQLNLPMRNDFASRHTPVPWRLSSNWGGQMFYNFYTDTFPRKREYHYHTNRPQDFNPPLNRTELTLSETATPGIIRIDMDTFTPGFECFAVSCDGNITHEVKSDRFEWPLHEGLNTIRVRARNSCGVFGPESSATVVMNR